MHSVLNLLKNVLQTHILRCHTHIQALPSVKCERKSILEWFRGLSKSLKATINSISKFYKEVGNNLTGFIKILSLYLTQIITSMSLLIIIFVQEEKIKHVISEARRCVSKQIVCCLESLEVALNVESVDDPSGNFVNWMDAALDKVSKIRVQRNQCGEARRLFEEVLSHAMSIAQVSLSEDSKIIRGSCQAVLSALNTLEEEIGTSPPNLSMMNLFVDACSSKLCLLEKKVNTAVLKLCLRTFSRLTEPLDKIRDFCFDDSNKTKSDELDGLVADFDLHVDRIMQIGLFAVSCSSHFGRDVKIRSCLASLEALESELVPTLTSALLDKTPHNVTYAKILMGHWTTQAVALQDLIYLIVDPFAFCQVIYEECVEIVDALNNTLKQKRWIKREDVDDFVTIASVLQRFLAKARTEFSDKESKSVEKKLNDFIKVLHEVKVAAKVLLTTQNSDLDNCKRVLKRCKILLTLIKRLWYCFADDETSRNVSSVKTQPDAQVESTGNGFLDHIIKRGEQILHDRSVLYKTPIKTSVLRNSNKGLSVFTNRKEMSLCKFVHLRKLPFASVNNSRNDTSFDLHITDILNELSASLRSVRINDA